MIPKPKREINEADIEFVRSIPYCEYCGNSNHYALETHHIKSRGSGGS